tara:strand:+ start:233 stop:1486 length:1254 start_codon:yes stop_codon:yes gene_type:complete
MGYSESYDTGQTNIKIVKLDNRKNYYLYIYDSNTRKVGYASLGTANLDDCKKNWFQTYANYVKKGGSQIKQKKSLLSRKLKEYIDYQFSRVSREEIKQRSFDTFHERIRNRITPFVKHSGVVAVSDISRKSFQDYAAYYKEKSYDTSTINSDLTTFNNFLNWLVETEEVLDANKKPKLKKLQQVKDFKSESNPAFTGEDWDAFKQALFRYEYLDESWTDDMEERERWWYRKMFVCWILFQFHSGNRPHETSRLKFGDVSYKEYQLPNGGNTLQGVINIARDTKRGSRTSVMNGWYIKRVIDHFHTFNHPKWLAVSTNDETPLFLNPQTGKPLHTETFRGHFKNVIRYAGLENKKYTLYSLRSGHITMQLLNGVSVDDISRNLGTSRDMISKHYDGVANILKSDELLKLNKHYYSDSN